MVGAENMPDHTFALLLCSLQQLLYGVPESFLQDNGILLQPEYN